MTSAEDVMPFCICGCGGKTKGGSFIPGHDAKLKSILIKGVLEQTKVEALETLTPDECLVVLEERGWTKFLDKARDVASRPKKERRAASKEKNTSEAWDEYTRFKQAGERLKAIDRYYMKDTKLTLTKKNIGAVLDLSDEALKKITQEELDEL